MTALYSSKEACMISLEWKNKQTPGQTTNDEYERVIL